MAKAKPPVLVDTSVLVAASVAVHPAHARSRAVLSQAPRHGPRLVVAAHALAEAYAVLSTMPLSPRVSPQQALALVERNIAGHAAAIVDLVAADYLEAVRRLAGLGFAGGITCDMLHVVAAEKAGAREIITLNTKDFDRIAPGMARTP